MTFTKRKETKMTTMLGRPFTKSNLIISGGYIYYAHEGEETPNAELKFVARFKGYTGKCFAAHLRKHWTAEAYFEEFVTGKTPLEIAQMTGYISPNMKKALRSMGYMPNAEGLKEYKAFRAAGRKNK